MMDLKNRIENAKAAVRKAENAKTIAETQQENAEGQLKEIEGKMLEAGVTPETVQQEIADLEAKLQADISKVERLIPTDI